MSKSLKLSGGKRQKTFTKKKIQKSSKKIITSKGFEQEIIDE